MNFLQVKRAVRSMVPEFPGWKIYDTIAPAGASPPWIVVKVAADGMETSEAESVTTGFGQLDVRVVSLSADSCDLVCDRLHTALDGLYVPACSSCLTVDADSGVYPSELKSTQTGQPFLMRVIRWNFGWPNQ